MATFELKALIAVQTQQRAELKTFNIVNISLERGAGGKEDWIYPVRRRQRKAGEGVEMVGGV